MLLRRTSLFPEKNCPLIQRDGDGFEQGSSSSCQPGAVWLQCIAQLLSLDFRFSANTTKRRVGWIFSSLCIHPSFPAGTNSSGTKNVPPSVWSFLQVNIYFACPSSSSLIPPSLPPYLPPSLPSFSLPLFSLSLTGAPASSGLVHRHSH